MEKKTKQETKILGGPGGSWVKMQGRASQAKEMQRLLDGKERLYMLIRQKVCVDGGWQNEKKENKKVKSKRQD